MRKFTVIALALAATFMFVVPAMAVDMEWSGHYRVRGFYTDNMELNEDESQSDAAWDHRIRLQPVFKITDNIKLTTRFDGHDNRQWGSETTIKGATSDDEDFGLERVYADITFDLVSLRVGTMAAGFCGITYCDSEGDADRVKVILNDIEPYYLDFTYQKSVENDYQGDESDADFDAYYLHGFYTGEDLLAGLLWGYYDDATGEVAGTADYKANYWLFNPYVQGTHGPLAYMAEAQWRTGDYRDFADATDDRDYDSWRWIADVAFNADVATVGAGWAHSDGQEFGENDFTNADGGGADWEPFLILTHNYANHNLGGQGNLNPDNSSQLIKDLGFDIYYVYGSMVPMEKLTLSAILGWAYAAEDNPNAAGGTKVDDEMGWEFDIGAKYQVMDNLSYDVKLGYFSPGDLWEEPAVGGADYDDATWSVMHSLVVTF